MPRQKNDLPTVQLRISTTPQIRELLEQLVNTGMWGKNATEAADRLLSQKLMEITGAGLGPKIERNTKGT